MRSAQDVLRFWFVEHGKDDWFGGKAEFDAELAARFAETHAAVAKGEAWLWRETSEGRLAEIIVLDQFSRQLHRGAPEAFAQDKMALTLAQELLAGGHHAGMSADQRMFVLLPFMHAESRVIQAESMRLHEELADADNLDYARKHFETVERFGRFPYRNRALGRPSTPDELIYMAEMGARGF